MRRDIATPMKVTVSVYRSAASRQGNVSIKSYSFWFQSFNQFKSFNRFAKFKLNP